MKEAKKRVALIQSEEIETTLPTEEQVKSYLKTNPNFFRTQEQLLCELDIPHSAGSAVSLVERQVALLRERNIANVVTTEKDWVKLDDEAIGDIALCIARLHVSTRGDDLMAQIKEPQAVPTALSEE